MSPGLKHCCGMEQRAPAMPPKLQEGSGAAKHQLRCSSPVNSQAQGEQGGKVQPSLTHGLGNVSSVARGSSHSHQQLSFTNHQGDDDFNSESSPAHSNDFSNHPDHKLTVSTSAVLSPTEP